MGAWAIWSRRTSRSLWTALWGGLIAAIAANSVFNFWRFGTFQNSFLLQPHFRVPDLATHLSFTAGLWFSPNGGLLFFWPAFLALLAVLIRRPVGFFVLALLAGLTLGLGQWFAPMGWIAWGPRLVLPWIPAWILLLGDRKLPRALWIPAIGVGLAHVMSLMSFAPKDLLFGATPECPVPQAIETAPTAYYACIQHLTWPWHSFALLDAWLEIYARPLHLVMAAAYLVIAICLVKSVPSYVSKVRTER
jgi:hypothetical protein